MSRMFHGYVIMIYRDIIIYSNIGIIYFLIFLYCRRAADSQCWFLFLSFLLCLYAPIHGYESSVASSSYHIRPIRENQIFYRTYSKLGYDAELKGFGYDAKPAEEYFDNRFIGYHMEFFGAGITRIIRMWLENGCKESPGGMMEILRSEYRGRLTPNP